MQIRGNVVAQKGKEGGDGESFVAISEEGEVNALSVEEDAQPCDDGVDGDHP